MYQSIFSINITLTILLLLSTTYMLYNAVTQLDAATQMKPVKQKNQRMVDKIRVQRVQYYCEKYELLHSVSAIPAKQLSQIFVDEVNKLLYCAVPRTGRSVWKKLLFDRNNGSRELKQLGLYDIDRQLEVLKNFKKFLITRNPYERVVSLYRSKFGEKLNFIKSQNKSVTGRFDKFVQLLLVSESDSDNQPATELCHPCCIRYDLIGRYEEIKEDAAYILLSINASHLKFPYQKSTTGSIFEQYFATLRERTLLDFNEYFEQDFHVFGYQQLTRFAGSS